MKKLALGLLLAVFALLSACASSGGRSSARSDEPGKPSVLKPTLAEIPDSVRAIEGRIDDETVILAGEAVIQVSKNYEMELSLSGDDVSPKDLDPSGGVMTVGRGKCTAFLRNLKIVCDSGIRVQIADFGTNPYINVSARGHCSHIIPGKNGSGHDVKRAQAILIRNERLQYLDSGAEQIAAFLGER